MGNYFSNPHIGSGKVILEFLIQLFVASFDLLQIIKIVELGHNGLKTSGSQKQAFFLISKVYIMSGLSQCGN